MLGKFAELLRLEHMGGDYARLYRAVAQGKNCMAFSLGMPHRIHVAANLDRFVLYLARDNMEVSRVYGALSDYFGTRVGMLESNQDVLIYHKAVRKGGVGARVRTLGRLLGGELECVVTTPQALMQYYPRPERVLARKVTIQIGQTYDMYRFIDELAQMGYVREDVVEEKNTFSVSGDIVCVFPPDLDMPLRISFFGDTVESIKRYEPESRMSTGSVAKIELTPDNELLFTHEEIARAIDCARKEASRLPIQAATRANEILDDLCTYGTCDQRMQWLIPYLTGSMAKLGDYLPPSATVVLDEPSSIAEQFRLFEQEHFARVKTLVADGEVLKSHVKAVCAAHEAIETIATRPILGFANITSSNTLFSPQETFNLKCSSLGAYKFSYEALNDDLHRFINAGYMTVVCMGSRDRASSFAEGLNREDVPCLYAEDAPTFRHGITVTPLELAHGFVYPTAKLAVIGREDVHRTKEIAKENKKKVFTMPKVGDYVVHEVHGIGRCLGVQRVKTGDIEQDYVACEYRNGDMLYVPIDQLDRLSRYSGSDVVPRLSAIGGKDFERVKESVRKSVREMAINLVDLYAKRQKRIGHKYESDTVWQQEFEDAFEFEETPDQLEAIRDCKADMERGIIMDRLLCGDVGYGKTEVALRVVFKTILENKQAVILAPTTILARQHYNTAMARFNPFKIRVELISRFQSPQQIKQSLDNLATGKSSVAVATHRILSDDVQFKDLGLLVLDEEQRFGVEHKEKLKVLKNNVNVLTMSATPIPRTLNMALTGIRDISVLETPPRNRLPVQTSVADLTDGLLQDAVNRELARGGQVYILYNAVSTIEAFAEHVRSVVPNARIVVGHGQMASDTLENCINLFYNKEADVLICTTIIENGIDVADANTLIVCDADRLGLAQLYQLRGRVGRSNRVAYAYFTVKAGKVLTETASKRLNAILDYTELGSGFKIAMRDLEIRGAGNILGKEQSGHIQKVGYDLYCKLLKESVDELQGIETPSAVDVKVNVDVNAYLDGGYIADDNTRLRIYREIIDLQTLEQRDKLEENLKENYGFVPQELAHLLDLGLMKNIAAKAGICQISIGPKGAGFHFSDESCYRNETLMHAVSDLGDRCLMTYDTHPSLIFDCKFKTNAQKLMLLKDFLVKVNKNL